MNVLYNGFHYSPAIFFGIMSSKFITIIIDNYKNDNMIVVMINMSIDFPIKR